MPASREPGPASAAWTRGRTRLSNGDTGPPSRKSRVSVLAQLNAVSAEHPGRTALTAPDGEHTYADLAAMSDRIRSRLSHLGLRPTDRVAVALEPGALQVACMLGVMAAGAVYVPVDPAGPAARTAHILSSAAPALVIGDIEASGALLTTDEAGSIAASSLNVAGRPPMPTEHDDAYIIFTSGTTGIPNGVPVTHGSLAALFSSTARMHGIDRGETWIQCHSPAFDFSVWEIFGALLSGGRLVIPPRSTVVDPVALSGILRREKVAVLNQTPTAFSNLAPELLETNLSGALRSTLEELPKVIIFGGEKLLPGSLSRWWGAQSRRVPRAVNMYGITETTVHATFHEVSFDEMVSEPHTSVIGRVLPGFSARVVGEDGSEQPEGELLLAGPQVSRGYIGDLSLSTAKFVKEYGLDGAAPVTWYHSGDVVRRRADGTLVYLGRNDRQVKVRGHRVELAEIEVALRQLGGVRDAVAFQTASGAGADALVAAYTTEAGSRLDEMTVRRAVNRSLPAHMRLQRAVPVERLPMTRNGKIDRELLEKLVSPPQPGASGPVAPLNPSS